MIEIAVGVVEKVGLGVVGFKVGERVGFMPASDTCRASPAFNVWILNAGDGRRSSDADYSMKRVLRKLCEWKSSIL